MPALCANALPANPSALSCLFLPACPFRLPSFPPVCPPPVRAPFSLSLPFLSSALPSSLAFLSLSLLFPPFLAFSPFSFLLLLLLPPPPPPPPLPSLPAGRGFGAGWGWLVSGRCAFRVVPRTCSASLSSLLSYQHSRRLLFLSIWQFFVSFLARP